MNAVTNQTFQNIVYGEFSVNATPVLDEVTYARSTVDESHVILWTFGCRTDTG